MKLKRLTVQGFKSFKDRTTIHFDQGITGIVGPNGCGKSNIVDALFWVMGEQSAKHLRGSSMQDLIFSGSSKYAPAHWAEVSLVLENDEGKHIHIGPKVSKPSEIQLSRKIYKNSETEYRINDVPCRLKDVQEVFMDTGAGAKSYSIIAQGEINRIVLAKPEERRVMIEDVAGITKFKKRRKESLKKIESTQGNLNRLNDLKQEIHKNLKSLERQAEKAERARFLKEKVRKYELITGAHNEYDLLRDLRDGQNFVREKKLEIEGWKTQRSSLELGNEKEKLRKEESIDEIESKESAYNDLSKKLVALEERLNYLKISLNDKELQTKNRQKENVDIEKDLAERKKRLELLETEFQTLKDSWKDSSSLAQQEMQLEAQRADLQIKTTEAEQRKKLSEDKKRELQEQEQKQFRNSTSLTESSAKLQDLSKEIDSLEKHHGHFSSETVTLREEIEVLEGQLAGINAQIQQEHKELQEAHAQKKEVEQTLKALSKKVAVTDSKLISLKSLAPALSAPPIDGLTRLSEVIFCDEKYAKGVQNLLRSLLESFLCKDSDTLGQSFAWVNSSEGAGVKFVMAQGMAESSSETKTRLEFNNVTAPVELTEIIKFKDPSLEQDLMPLLSGLFLCEDIDLATVTSFPKDLKLRGISTFDGRKVLSKDPTTLQVTLEPANQRQLGPIEIANKVMEVEQELALDRNELAAIEEKINTLENTVQSLDLGLRERREAATKLKEDLILKKASFQSKQHNYEANQAKLEILTSRKTEISKSRLSLMEEEEKLASSKLKLEAESKELLVEAQSLLEGLEGLKTSFEQQRQALLEEKLFQKNYDEKVASTERQIADNRGQLEKLAARLEQNASMLGQLEGEREQLNIEIQDGKNESLSMAEILKEKNAELSVLKDQLSELLAEMQEREDQSKKLLHNINKTEKELIEYDIKLAQIPVKEDQLVRDIFEKYRVNLRSVLGQFLEFTSADFELLKNIDAMFVMETAEGPEQIASVPYEFVRRFGKEIKEAEEKFKQYRNELNRIGDVNWQAIEDYEQQKLRFDFLVAQEQELKNSLRDLEIAIQHIDEKSTARFAEAFKEVSERFEKVFPIIFGGGSARLDIVGNLSDPECGVEINAQPPGKKMQNLNLMSGGEKAMTALSLIFSIFLVKPSPFCLLDEVDAPLDDANVGRFNDLLREMSGASQFVLITHNKKTMELNDMLYGVTMQEAGVSTAVSVQLH